MSALGGTTSGKEKSTSQSALGKQLKETGRFPDVKLLVSPLEGKPFVLDKWLGYSFTSSMLVPVDTFSFEVVAPDLAGTYYDLINSGDIVQLVANEITIATGIVDSVDVSSERERGERVAIAGRDLMAQFEDNNCVSITDAPMYAGTYTPSQVVNKLSENTRIDPTPILQDAPKNGYLFATEPGDSKLSALQRYLEPLNCIAWMNQKGKVIVGRPNMAQQPKGNFFLVRSERRANVLSMKVVRETTRVPNIVVPIWSGQETVQSRVPLSQRINNPDPDADRLRRLGHRVIKAVVVSSPSSSDPQELAKTNEFVYAGNNILQAYAKREIARANVDAVSVQVVMAGHYDENGDPVLPDSVWGIEYERGNVNENMYLYSVSYKLDENEGQISILDFCRLGSIVSGIKAP